jgi:GNAT superfamily N-acetyltransferase
MQYEIVATEAPTAADRDSILALLIAYNDSRAGPHGYKPLAILLRDTAGSTIGGLWGRSVYDWLYVELLGVPEALRRQGIGSRLIHRAEAEATARGCAGVWVDTYAFQARGFLRESRLRAFRHHR